MRTLKNWLVYLLSVTLLFMVSCGETSSQQADDANLDGSDVEFLINEEEAMLIAMEGMNPEIYQSTSTISGPMEYTGEEIMAYEVTVNGGDHLYLRYVNTMTGELLTDYDVKHEKPGTDPNLSPDVRAAYYNSCPNGWLCISRPDTIYFYSQNDPTWACDYLGESTYWTLGDKTYGATCSHSMKAAGCVIAAYSMALKENGYACWNPRDLNNIGKEKISGDKNADSNNNCFSGADVISSCIVARVGANYSTIGVHDVWNKLAQGYAVVAYGKSSCLGRSTHAQMIWGHDGSRYWTKDPWYDWSNQDQPICLTGENYRLIR